MLSKEANLRSLPDNKSSSKDSSVLVTGGAGYIGSALISRLLEDDYNIVSVDNLKQGSYGAFQHYEGNPHLTLTVGNVSNLDALEKLFRSRRFDSVIHLAAVVGLEECQRNAEEAVSTNIRGTENLLEVAVKYGVEKVAFSSSAAVYGKPVHNPIIENHTLKPKNLYGDTKVAGENLLQAYYEDHGLCTVSLRLSNIYGVGLYTNWETVIPKFVKQGWEGKPLTIYGDGEQARDYVHVWDVVEALRLALKSNPDQVGGQAFNVGSGESVSVNSVAEIVSQAFKERYGREVQYVHLPTRRDEVYTPTFRYSIAKIRRIFGFHPQTSLRDGVNQLVAHSVNLQQTFLRGDRS